MKILITLQSIMSLQNKGKHGFDLKHCFNVNSIIIIFNMVNF